MSTRATGVALVTGASGGIGGAVALRLASDGFSVVAHYAGSSTQADQVVSAITAKGGHAIAIKADVSNPAEVRAMFAETRTKLGRVDAVIHCAGIMPLVTIESGDLAVFDQVIQTNLRGSFIILSEAARALSGGGRIVALSSSVVAKALPTYGPYIASKAGVEGLVHGLANELRGRNITVNGVAPGPIATPLFFHGKAEAQIEQFAKLAPLETPGAARRYRERRVIPHRAGRGLGERTNPPRQRRIRLSAADNLPCPNPASRDAAERKCCTRRRDAGLP